MLWRMSDYTYTEWLAHSVNIASILFFYGFYGPTYFKSTLLHPPTVSYGYLTTRMWRWLTSLKSFIVDSLSRIFLQKLVCLQPGMVYHNTLEYLRINSKKNTGNGQITHCSMNNMTAAEIGKTKKIIMFPILSAWKFCHIFNVFIGRSDWLKWKKKL